MIKSTFKGCYLMKFLIHVNVKIFILPSDQKDNCSFSYSNFESCKLLLYSSNSKLQSAFTSRRITSLLACETVHASKSLILSSSSWFAVSIGLLDHTLKLYCIKSSKFLILDCSWCSLTILNESFDKYLYSCIGSSEHVDISPHPWSPKKLCYYQNAEAASPLRMTTL